MRAWMAVHGWVAEWGVLHGVVHCSHMAMTVLKMQAMGMALHCHCHCHCQALPQPLPLPGAAKATATAWTACASCSSMHQLLLWLQQWLQLAHTA